MKKICVTGASGFIGQSLCKALSRSGYFVRGFVRNLNIYPKLKNLEYVKIGNKTVLQLPIQGIQNIMIGKL